MDCTLNSLHRLQPPCRGGFEENKDKGGEVITTEYKNEESRIPRRHNTKQGVRVVEVDNEAKNKWDAGR